MEGLAKEQVRKSRFFSISFILLFIPGIHQICQWLLAQNMETYIALFTSDSLTGEDVIALDGPGLKELGIRNKEDRDKIKKKIKELRAISDRERRGKDKLIKRASKK